MKKNYLSLIVGVAIIIVGIILSGNALNFWHIDVFFDGWWTLFLIFPGLTSILRYGFSWGSGIILTIGVIFLLDSQNIISSKLMWNLVFPLMVVAIGVSMILSFFRKDEKTIEVENSSECKKKNNNKDKHYKGDNLQNPKYSTVFGGGEVQNNSDDLESVTVEAVFGGFDVDLRDAKITKDIDLNITVVLGGVDVYLPYDVDIVIASGTPIFGGLSCRKNKVGVGSPKVRVNYVTVLGGAEIH